MDTFNCWSCELISSNYDTADKLAAAFVPMAAQVLLTFFGIFSLSYLSYKLVRSIMDGKFMEEVRGLWRFFFAVAVCNALLINMANGGRALWTYGLEPLQSLAAATSIGVVNLGLLGAPSADMQTINDMQMGRRDTPADMQNPYGMLAGVLEIGAGRAVQFGVWMMNQSSLTTWTGPILGGLLVILPWIFVIGIFCAYILEAVFTLMAITLMSPALAFAYPFPIGRPYVGASVRILLSGLLTLVFAGAALGFSVAVVENLGGALVRDGETATQTQAALEAAEDAADKVCPNIAALTLGIATESATCKARKAELEAIKAEADAYNHPLWSAKFWQLVILGFVSILMHMKARTLASNMAGVQDGAGPAVATVAAIKGAGLMMLQKMRGGGSGPLGGGGNSSGNDGAGGPSGSGDGEGGGSAVKRAASAAVKGGLVGGLPGAGIAAGASVAKSAANASFDFLKGNASRPGPTSTGSTPTSPSDPLDFLKGNKKK